MFCNGFSTVLKNRCFVGLLASAMALGFAATGGAQEKDAKGADDAAAAPAQGSQVDPLKRPIPDKQRQKNAMALKIELS